jgi:hypothetical protein
MVISLFNTGIIGGRPAAAATGNKKACQTSKKNSQVDECYIHFEMVLVKVLLPHSLKKVSTK